MRTTALAKPAFKGTPEQQSLATDLRYYFRAAPWSMSRSTAIDAVADGAMVFPSRLRDELQAVAENGKGVAKVEAVKLLVRI